MVNAYDEFAHANSGAEPSGADGRNLPASFWSERAVFAHISRAAHSRLISRDALLGVALARLVALSPHNLRLPPIVGAPCGMTLYSGIVGPSGASKSSALGTGAELLPCDNPAVADLLPIGSGEGIVECLFDFIERDDGKPKVKEQVHYGAIVYIDEGSMVADFANRRGSILLPVLRTAFTHGTIGQTNATTDRKRIVRGDRYVYGIVMGIQAELAGPLLGDYAAGTPQRFLWLSATDPDIPHEREEWPGPLPWKPVSYERMREYNWSDIHVADAIQEEIRAQRRDVMRGDIVLDPLDAHRMLVRLKVAAALALFEERTHVGGEDWRLAGMVLDTSDAVRAGILATLAAVEHVKEQAVTARHIRLETATEDDKAVRALRSAARSAANVVRSHEAARTHEAERGCSRRCIGRAIAGSHRSLVSVADVIAEAGRRDWIAALDGRWVPGRQKPS